MVVCFFFRNYNGNSTKLREKKSFLRNFMEKRFIFASEELWIGLWTKHNIRWIGNPFLQSVCIAFRISMLNTFSNSFSFLISLLSSRFISLKIHNRSRCVVSMPFYHVNSFIVSSKSAVHPLMMIMDFNHCMCNDRIPISSSWHYLQHAFFSFPWSDI